MRSTYSFKEIQEKFNKGIEELDLPNHPQELYDPMRYLLHLNGKRIRPCMLLMGANLFKEEIDSYIDQALAMEVFHNFTLMHDDIMDQAPLRRGNMTVHEKWNLPIAILSGDAMLVEAYRLLLKASNEFIRPIFKLFNDTATQVCEGQQLDMNFETGPKVSLDQYLHMIELKTAVLLGCCLKMGGILAGANAQDTDHLFEFGKNLGIAFQLQDDLLDVYGEPSKFGKQIGGDILANKKTFLLIEALDSAKGNCLNELKYWLELKNFEPVQKIQAVRAIYDQLSISEKVENEIRNFHKLAMVHLIKIQVEPERRKVLEELTDALLLRQH